MSGKGTFFINITSLSEGEHAFAFDIGKDFFYKIYPDTEILDANLKVHITLNYLNKIFNFKLNFDGTLDFECDRCLNTCTLDVDINKNLIFSVETGKSAELNTETEVIFIDESTEFINLDEYFYDFVILSLPIRKVHDDLDLPESKCNPDVLNKISNIQPTDKSNNLHFSNLKNLMNNN